MSFVPTTAYTLLVWPIMGIMLALCGLFSYRFPEMRPMMSFYVIGVGTGYLIRKVTTFKRP